ncbi:MAG: hypothetical protein AB7O28_01635 [Vicinamibacterales bacterium]
MSSDLSPAERALLRHMIATLAYRGGKVLRDAPAGFAAFAPAGVLNPPVAVLAHVADLIEWTCRWCDGDEEAFRPTEPGAWDTEVARFFAALSALDARVAAPAAIAAPLDRLFQAPIADAFTHVGQIALLRRMAGAPVLGEAYRKADIAAGRVGPDQAPPGREFPPDKGAFWRPPSRG